MAQGRLPIKADTWGLPIVSCTKRSGWEPVSGDKILSFTKFILFEQTASSGNKDAIFHLDLQYRMCFEYELNDSVTHVLSRSFFPLRVRPWRGLRESEWGRRFYVVLPPRKGLQTMYWRSCLKVGKFPLLAQVSVGSVAKAFGWSTFLICPLYLPSLSSILVLSDNDFNLQLIIGLTGS